MSSKVFGRADFYKEFRKKSDLKISHGLYNHIIKRLHNKIIEKLLEGHSVKLPYSLGVLVIKRSERNNPLPNWGESNKNKAELIAQGKLPLKVTKRDKDGNPCEDNGGERWVVYHNDPYYYELVWIKNTATKFVPNSKYYRMKTLDTMKDKISERMNTMTDLQKELLFQL